MGADVGDPGFGSFLKRAFTPPKAIRKLQVGKAVGSLARIAAPFIPGIGGVAATVLTRSTGEARPAFTPPTFAEVDPREPAGFGISPLQMIADRWGLPVETIRGIGRAYGYDVGGPPSFDKMTAHPGLGTGYTAAALGMSKRSMASSTPTAKAAAAKPSIDFGALIRDIASTAGGVARMLPGPVGALANLAGGVVSGVGGNLPTGIALPGMPGMPYSRVARRIDPRTGLPFRKKQRVINLTALDHACGRINRFQKVASRVMRKPSYKHATEAPAVRRRKRRAA